MEGETNTDDLSPATHATTRPDIPLHALAILETRYPGALTTINNLKEKGYPLAYVGDVVDANIKVGLTDKISWLGEVFNIGAGDNRSVNDVANLLGGEKIHRDPVIEPKATLADNSKAKNVLNWKPTQDFEKWVVGWKKELGL